MGKLLSVLVLSLVLAACGATRSYSIGDRQAERSPASVVASKNLMTRVAAELPPDPQIAQEIVSVDDKLEKHPHSTPVPPELNKRVQKWLVYFSGRDNTRFQRFLDRGEVYRPLIEKILIQEGIPKEFYYLAMIESGFVTHATSHASAVGIWQFIPGTAKRFGLKRDSYVDERRDVIRATQAAAVYLRNLHAAFQSWYLAMAGYNAGEGRILRAVVNGGSRDFWELVDRKALPAETRDYVPKFLAALIIGKNPGKYGFRRPAAQPFPDAVAVPVPGGVPLAEIARNTQVSLSVLKQLNPHLMRDTVPPHRQPYPVWIPAQHARSVRAVAASLRRAPAAVAQARVAQSGEVKRYHRVRRGETLSSVSAKYNVSINYLRRANRLRSNKIQVGQRLLVATSQAPAQPSYVKYRIRRGDALSAIADRFGVSITTLMSFNSLKTTRIYAGQRIRVPRGL